jgi:peptidyl-prolyl cis-trans isomerase SurA
MFVRFRNTAAALFAAHLLVALVALPLTSRAAAPGRVVDRVVAWVNGEPITLSEIEEALAQYQADDQISPGAATEGRLRAALERFVDETLMMKAAATAGVSVTPEVIDNRVGELFSRLEKRYGGAEVLDAALERAGQSRDRLRERLRKQVKREWTIAQAIAGRVDIGEAEVEAFEKERREHGQPTVRYEVSHAFLAAPDKAPESWWTAAEGKLHDLRIATAKTDSFAAAAALWAADHADEKASGGPLGVLTPEEMQPELAQAAANLEAGATSPPVRTPQGVHLLHMDRRTTARQMLFAERYETTKKKWLEELRAAASIQIAETLLP